MIGKWDALQDPVQHRVSYSEILVGSVELILDSRCISEESLVSPFELRDVRRIHSIRCIHLSIGENRQQPTMSCARNFSKQTEQTLLIVA